MMTQLNELRIMNDTMINYLKKMGISTKRNEIIRKIFEDDACFFKMDKNDALLILNEVGIKEKIEEFYSNLISTDTFYDLYNNGKINENDSEIVIKYKIHNDEALFNNKNKDCNISEKNDIQLIKHNQKFNFLNDLLNKIKKFFMKK